MPLNSYEKKNILDTLTPGKIQHNLSILRKSYKDNINEEIQSKPSTIYLENNEELDIKSYKRH